ncbi:MAG: PAS domain-containing protein [Desulfomonile tiedjei]|nr:PAS domain-containing protein [Desulfomonile tiedjei]
MPQDEKDRDSHKRRDECAGEPDYLRLSENPTESIDVESLFSKDVTVSGSFDLRQMKDVSFGKLLSALPVPTFLVDAAHRIVFSNQFSSRTDVGTSPQLGAPFASLFPGEPEGERADMALARVFTLRKTEAIDGLVQLHGRMRWCRIHFRSIRFRKERLVLAIFEDFTAEKKRLHANEKYHRLVQIFPIGIAEFRLEHPIFLTRPIEEILGSLSEARLVGGNPEFAKIYGFASLDLLKDVLLGEMLPLERSHELLYRTWIKNHCRPRSVETRDRGLGGATRYFETTLVGNMKDEMLSGLWVMRKDITDRKESEEMLRTARDKLEERVTERTAELLMANEKLQLEVAERQKAERELAKLVKELKDALAQVRTLKGLLPICASCKKIRDDHGYWTQVEVYVCEHSEAEFTHSICPDCLKKLYPSLYDSGPMGEGA